MSMTFRGVAGVLLGMVWAASLSASPTYWLSDVAPTKELAKKMRSSHGGLVMRGKRGMYIKRLWLRQGEGPHDSTYVPRSDAPLLLVDPDVKLMEMAFGNNGFADVTFDMPVEGFYNVFMIDRRVEDGRLQVSVIKNESLNHSCRAGHDHIEPKMPPLYYDGAPIDIIRERLPKESFHTRLTTGDLIHYRVMLHGKPLEGAAVTVITQKGWAKRLKSDAEGRVSFEMIRDYYPPWHEFKRRNMESFLVVAEYESADGGVHEGERYGGVRYKATSAGNYYPSTRDYQSYLYGLLIGIFGLTLTGLLIYRRRRAAAYGGKRLA